MQFFREFKPTILFLVKFIVLYLLLNLGYGLFVDIYSPTPDPLTRWVSEQSVVITQMFGVKAEIVVSRIDPYIGISSDNKNILSVYEGCNGANVAIIFIAFLLSFGNPSNKLLWFIPVGLLVIHLTNLFRITLLFFVSVKLPGFMYFAHKYLFTAIIYIITFFLWYIWIDKLYKRGNDQKDTHDEKK